MRLFIVRHAFAYEHGDPRWPDDSRRPLEPDGAKRFAKGVKKLADRGFEPEIIATSPFVRCRQTADLVSEGTVHAPEVVELTALQPGSDLDAVIAWSIETGRSSIAWVGHSPDVERLASKLIGDGAAAIRFAKGAVAAIRFDEDFEPGEGELEWLATAKVLGV